MSVSGSRVRTNLGFKAGGEVDHVSVGVQGQELGLGDVALDEDGGRAAVHVGLADLSKYINKISATKTIFIYIMDY